jgi:hypothetical protein
MIGSTCMTGLSHLQGSAAPQFKVFLSKVEPQIIDGLVKLIKEFSTKPNPN